MEFRACSRWRLLPYHHLLSAGSAFSLRLPTTNITRSLHAARSSVNGGGSGGGGGGRADGNFLLVPGATVATILMLGVLHARRLYGDKKIEEMKEKGIELEFSPDAKAAFLRLLPLRTMSRIWGFIMSLEIPISFRPVIYKAWARAFHSNLEEAGLPLESYPSLQDFFIRTLKEGARPIDQDPNCLVSPVDGTILRLGELRGPGALIEQVKGFSYSAFSLLGASSSLHEVVDVDVNDEHAEPSSSEDKRKGSWWRISFASPKVRNPISSGQMKGVFYCVLYLHPGDYHRVHSPVDWHVFVRRHFPVSNDHNGNLNSYASQDELRFSIDVHICKAIPASWSCDGWLGFYRKHRGCHLFPLNERATRTIRNLHIENERVVLEGQWREGFMAVAAIGATNIGSIKLLFEPELKTNRPKWKLLPSEPPEERRYEPQDTGKMLKKGEEVAAFRMGSTVVIVFQAPSSASPGETDLSSEFKFCVKRGDKVRVGEALGRWVDS